MGLADAAPTVGSQLIALGVSPVEAPMAVPYMFLAPAGSDPDMQAIHTIVRALQTGLNRLGAKLVVDGVLGAETAAALNQVSPPANSYARKSWYALTQDILKPIEDKRLKSVTMPALGAFVGVDIGLPWLIAGAAGVWWFFLRKKGRR